MKSLLLLCFTLILGADDFALVQPISVEKAPVSEIKTTNEVIKTPQKKPTPHTQEIASVALRDTTAQATTLPKDENTVPTEPLVTNDENLSKKDVSNELVKTKVLKITFKPSRAIITTDSNGQIEDFANFLQKNKQLQVVIYGYTDSIGNTHSNLKLSQQRAKNVVQALNALGIKNTRLTAVGMGEKDPVASNETPEGRAQNRRIEALIIK